MAGPLSGRSVAIKDNMSVAGLPMTIGTFAEFLSADGKYPISQIDASVVTRVLESGGTVAGIAVCENYSASALSFSPASGPVQNPWVHGYATGGSSSGCAALLAATLKKKISQSQDEGDWESGIELAIGGDQGGSIRIVSPHPHITASWQICLHISSLLHTVASTASSQLSDFALTQVSRLCTQ